MLSNAEEAKTTSFLRFVSRVRKINKTENTIQSQNKVRNNENKNTRFRDDCHLKGYAIYDIFKYSAPPGDKFMH